MATKAHRTNPLRANGLDLDLRTKVGRRVKAAAEVYAAQMGGWDNLSDRQVMDIQDAAAARVFLEVTRARYFEELGSGQHVSHDDVIRAENSFDRRVRRLGLPSDDNDASTLTVRDQLMGADDAT